MLKLLLSFFSLCVLSQAQSDRNSAIQWTELIRKSVDNYVKTNLFVHQSQIMTDLKQYSSKFPADVDFRWVHRDKSGQPWLCGGKGGFTSIQWLLGYMCQSNRVTSIQPAQASGDEIAAWKVTSSEDNKTRRARIVGQFSNGRLVGYNVEYDQTMPLI